MIYINAYIDSKYIAKDLISIHDMKLKFEMSYCNGRYFGECAFCGDIVRVKS